MTVPKHRTIEGILTCTIKSAQNGTNEFTFTESEFYLQKIKLSPHMYITDDRKVSLRINIETQTLSKNNYTFLLKLISQNPSQTKLFKTNVDLNNKTKTIVETSHIFPPLDKLIDPTNGYLTDSRITYSIKMIKQSNTLLLKRNKSQRLINSQSAQESVGTRTRKCGLVNYGCTCYMNSCLQIMYNIPFIRRELYKLDAQQTLYNDELLLKLPENDSDNMEEKNRATLTRKGKWEAKVNKIINALQVVFGKMENFKSAYYQPDELVSAFGWTAHNMLEQEDAHEFIRGILSKLEDRQAELYHFQDCMTGEKDFLNTNFNVEHMKGLTTIKDKLELKYLTCGLLNCTVQNDGLGFKIEKQEEFHDLTLDVAGHKDVYESMQAYLSPENLEGANQYYTGEYGAIDVVKTTKIRRLPPLLMLQLKRFNFCMETGQMSKISSKLAFYKELDMNSFVEDFEVDYSYKLYGFVVHKGNRLDSGHYFSLIDPQLNDKWYNFNDEDISRTNNNIEDYHGGERTPICAYLLVYIRTDSIQELMCKSENVYSYMNSSIANTIQKEKLRYEAKYIKMIETQNVTQQNTLLILQDNLFSKLLSGINETKYSTDVWIMASYLIYGSNPFRDFITRGLGFDVPSVKKFISGMNNIYNAQWCYKKLKHHVEIQKCEKIEPPNSNIENNVLNRNMFPINIAGSTSFRKVVKELIYYIKGKINFLKQKIPLYNPDINFDNIAIFRLSTNPTEEYSSGLRLVYPFDMAEGSEPVFMPSRNGFYICELNHSLLQNKGGKKTIVFIKTEAKFIAGENCYTNKGAFVVNSDLTLCALKKRMVNAEVIKENRYYIKIETLRNKKFRKALVDENTLLSELGSCVMINFDLEEYNQHYDMYTVGVAVHEQLKDRVSCDLESNGIVNNHCKFKIKKNTTVSVLKSMIKEKLKIDFDFEISSDKNTNLEKYKEKKASDLNGNSQVKNLTCNENYNNQCVVNSSMCDNIEKAIEKNDESIMEDKFSYTDWSNNNLNDNLEAVEDVSIDDVNEDELAVWMVYEHTGLHKEYAASYKYYQEDFKNDVPDYFFEIKEVVPTQNEQL